MNEKKKISESVIKPQRETIKTTPAKAKRIVDCLEERLFNACVFHVKNDQHYRFQSLDVEEAALAELESSIADFYVALAKVKETKSGPLAVSYLISHKNGLQKLLEETNGRLTKIQGQPKKRRGMQKTMDRRGDIALLLYSALEIAQGHRELIDKIGSVIAVDGPLKKRLEARFVDKEDVFANFKFPTVNPRDTDDRWERSPKAALLREARNYVLKASAKTNPEHAESYFRKVVLKGGYSAFELMLAEQEAYQS